MAWFSYRDSNVVNKVEGGEIGGSGVTSWNDLTDKPFYSESVTAELISEMEVVPFNELEFVIGLNNGNEYTVKLNDVEYKCVAFEFKEGANQMTYIGNANLLNEELPVSDFPFGICQFPDATIVLLDIPYFEENPNSVLSVIGETVIFHKINNEYLPQADFDKTGCVNYYSMFDVVKGGYLTLEIGSTIYGDVEEVLGKHALPPEVNYNNNTYYCISASHYGSSYSGDNFRGMFSAYAIDAKTNNMCRIDAFFSDFEYDSVLESVKITYPNNTILQSSTSGSTKQFQITVDDSGTIKATEVTT